MVAKLLLESIREADNGEVTCVLQTPQGDVRGTIEESFFQEFFGGADFRKLSPQRRQRVLAENQSWLEHEANRQLSLGAHQVVIR